MNTIDRSECLNLPDKKLKLMYTVKSVVMCEKELDSKNLLLTVAGMTAGPLSMGDAFALFKWGLLGDKKYDEKEIEDLFVECIEELDMITVQTSIIAALKKSGLLGEKK